MLESYLFNSRLTVPSFRKEDFYVEKDVCTYLIIGLIINFTSLIFSWFYSLFCFTLNSSFGCLEEFYFKNNAVFKINVIFLLFKDFCKIL